MNNVPTAAFTFALLSTVSLLSMSLHTRMPERLRDVDTTTAVSKIANIFVVITSLVFGLLITSSKSTFETVDHNIHAYATDLVLLDRMLRSYGSDANAARSSLQAYVREAIAHPTETDALEHNTPDSAGRALELLGVTLDSLKPVDPLHQQLLATMQSQYRNVVRERWTIVEQSEGALPRPIIGMLIAWLTLIFASYGFRAPKNPVVVSMLFASAFLISASLYLVLDMDFPFKGPIRVSYQPYHRALSEMQTP